MTGWLQRADPIRFVVGLAALVTHALLFGFFVLGRMIFDDQWQVLIIGFFLGQNSLVAMIASAGRGQTLLRVALPFAAAGLCWYGMCCLLTWGLRESAAVWWAIGIFAQTSLIIVGVKSLSVLMGQQGLCEQRFSGPGEAASDGEPADGSESLQFPLRTLIILTTVAAIGFAAIEYACRVQLLAFDSVNLSESTMMIVIGAILAFGAVASFFANAFKKRRWMLLAWLLVLASVIPLAYLLDWGALRAGLAGESDPKLAIELLMMHAMTITVTLVVMRCSRFIGGERRLGTEPSPQVS